jgi:hypothetical protein
MDLTKILELLSYTIPSIITGLVAYYFFVNHTKNEERKIKLSILKENQKQSLPIKLQAYERMTLFLERINLPKLLTRVGSVNNDKVAYSQSLISTIDQEFEHNIAQQIYISEECWNIIIASKNATIHIIKKTSDLESIKDAQEFREAIIKRMINSAPPSTAALAFIKNEVGQFI